MTSKDTFFSTKQTINCRGRLVDFSTPRLAGILNITPDSFYDGGRYTEEKQIIERAGAMLAEGADMIDVGAYSSRPGAADISPEEEISRLIKALKPVRQNFPDAIVSVDTFRAGVAEFVTGEFGVDIINDISAGLIDRTMYPTIARIGVPYVMMHMPGTPQNMQDHPNYLDVTREIISFFSRRLAQAAEAGIRDIIIDPGIGFGKTIGHNYTLLRELGLFRMLGLPIMIGVSRKSLIYKTLGTNPEGALNGTTVLNTLALQNGANILRVHDVKEASEAIRLFTLYQNASEFSDKIV